MTNKIFDILGNPDEVFEDDMILSLWYENLGISLDFDKDTFIDEGLTISAKKLIYEGVYWNKMKKNELVSTIESIYDKRNYKFEYSFDDDYTDNTEQYEFHKIGISLFFKDEILDEISISKPLND